MDLVKYNSQFENLISKYQIKYGDKALVVYMLRLQLLSELFKGLILRESEETKHLFDKQYIAIQKNMTGLKIANENKPKPVRHYLKNYEVLEFSHEYFANHYRNQMSRFLNDIIILTPINIKQFAVGKWYLYVYGSNGSLTIYDKAFMPLEMLSGRDGFPTHPMIGFKTNLEVLCAGELFIAKDFQNNLGIIINNKSGHYTPSNRQLEFTANRISHQFKIPDKNVYQLAYM
ncbi:hypothetical protein DA798_05555 [Lactobacillus sp. PFC-70]|nr:hypothetical protein DA798_05555 [Lactobacillus sp. PFC-70]